MAYPQTILFVSHDRKFIERVANELWILENQQITRFSGNYQAYIEHQKNMNKKKNQSNDERILILETRLSEIISKLSLPSPNDPIDRLNAEYDEVLAELRRLKNS